MNDDGSLQRYIFDIYGKTGNCSQSNTRTVPLLDRPKNHKVAIEGFVLKTDTSFSDVAKLIFETSSIPVVQSNLSADQSLQRKQLGEYYLSKDESDAKNDYIRYRADQYHEYDLDSDTNLRVLDLFVYKQSTSGLITPVTVDESGGLSLTLVFIRKS